MGPLLYSVLMLSIAITRISPTHHTFVYTRSDGTRESVELETKTYLLHDFTHFALESEAGITGGFYGLLAEGCSFEELSLVDENNPVSKEALNVERVVGPLSGFVESDMLAEELIAGLENLFGAFPEKLPVWVTTEVFEKTRERYRKLKSHWNALMFGETLELTFSPENMRL